MKILFGIEGGAGKNIAATGAVRIAKEAGHEVYVMTAWPQMWEGNPNVAKVHSWDKIEYFSEEVKQYDRIVINDAYRQSEFLLQEANLSAVYNMLLNGILEPVKPELYLTKAEYLHVQDLLKEVTKPIFAVQTNGGNSTGYAWARDLPTDVAVEIMEQYADKYEIIHMRGPGQLEIGGVKHVADLTIRESIVVLALSEKRLLIDSVYQHAAAALELPSVVTWVLTKPTQFGYDIHTNVLRNEPKLKNVERLDVLIHGLDNNPAFCPFSVDQEIFSTKEIIKALKQK